MLLASRDPQPTVAVNDLDTAKAFYGEVLGFQPVGPPMPGVQCYLAGKTVIVIYQSQFAGTNQGTAITWSLGADFDQAYAELRAKGVVFEHYDMPDIPRDGDIHGGGDMKLAWFKDPDGNIIHIGSY